MTTDKVLAGIKAWIVSRNSPSLVGVAIYLQDEAGEPNPPYISISDTGSEEHAVLRGVLKISVEVKLWTVPVELPEANDPNATSAAGHRALSDVIYNMIADTAMIPFLAGQDGLQCFDARGTTPTWEPEVDMRATTFKLDVVACPR